MTKCLWDQTFLKEKADALRITPSVQFWELDSELNVMKFKDEHFKKMIKKKVVIDQDITVKGIANAYKELI